MTTSLADPISTLSPWQFHSFPPSDWQARMAESNGGFFHSPLGLAAGAPGGEPMYVILDGDDGPGGIALGVRHACRLSRRPRHAYFPSLPAIRDPAMRERATEALIEQLDAEGIASVTIDSFDAGWQPSVTEGASDVHRREYVVSLERSGPEILAGCARTHRQKIRQGDRIGFRLEMHTGSDAKRAMEVTHAGARQRASARDETIGEGVPDIVDRLSGDLSKPWGGSVLGAWQDDVLMSAVLIGWGRKTVYAIMAGSTDAGYELNSATWLHFRIMTMLSEAGFTSYNMGGACTVTDACEQPPSGLQRFKLGFGATPVDCRGIRRVLHPYHALAHELRDVVRGQDQS